MFKEKICGCFRANLHSQQIEDEQEDLDLHSSSLTSINNEENLLHYKKFQEDQLSNFSDTVLIRILSFLPIKDAVQTSLLSKRWINLWRYVTDLRIDDRSFFYPEEDAFWYDLQKFEHFVYKLISKFSFLENLQSLTFSCQYSLNSRFFHSLISATLENNVPKIDISYFVKGFIFPTRLFECSSNLQELNLHMNGSIFNINSLIHHSSLRILRISRIVFANSPVVLFDFPSVEVFELESCTWSDIVQEVRIITPLAENFALRNCGREDESCCFCIVEICGPSVKKLSLASCELVQFFPPLNSCSVEDASIGFEIKSSDDHNWELWDEMYERACRIVEAVGGVQYLKLEMNTVQVLQYGGDFAASLPTFEKLVRLEIATPEIEFGSLLIILNKSPFLENLICETSITGKDHLAFEVAPLSHLKRVILKGLDGGEGDFRLVRYLLKNATMLEKMSVSMIPRGDSKNFKEKVEEQLLRSAQGSSQVAMEFLRHQVTRDDQSRRKEANLQFSTQRFFNMI